MNLTVSELHDFSERAQANVSAAAVLFDYLLETFPGFSQAIDEAHRLQRERSTGWSVWFFPMTISPTTLRYDTTHLAFEVHRDDVTREVFRMGSRHYPDEVRRALVMYHVPKEGLP